MPAPWNEDRWAVNDDGSYVRRNVLVSGDLSSLTKAELVRLAERQGLPKSGTKDELIERLQEGA